LERTSGVVLPDGIKVTTRTNDVCIVMFFLEVVTIVDPV